MKSFSEYVSLGHPDKIADYISQYLLDRYIEQDPDTRYAVEVQIKNSRVTLGGEVSSRVSFSPQFIRELVREAVNDIGYTREYMARWGEDNTICGDLLEVESLINQQSPDISRGLKGWGDQGIFFGYAEPDNEFGGMPKDHALAKRLCKELFESGLGGLDIKTQVVLDDNRVTRVIVAIPLLPDGYDKRVKEVERFVRKHLSGSYELTVNGTGRYVRHSSIADCGTTGRKLAVDFYGGGCRIGGGSPWTKDGSKADLSLNLVAREVARQWANFSGVPCTAALACCIGRQEVEVSVRDDNGTILREGSDCIIDPAEIRTRFGLDKPIYASMCRWGLFGEFQRDKAWERPTDGVERGCEE